MTKHTDEFQGKWKQAQGQVKDKFGKLNDDDMSRIEQNPNDAIGCLQERYGYDQKRAEREWSTFMNESGYSPQNPQETQPMNRWESSPQMPDGGSDRPHNRSGNQDDPRTGDRSGNRPDDSGHQSHHSDNDNARSGTQGGNDRSSNDHSGTQGGDAHSGTQDGDARKGNAYGGSQGGDAHKGKDASSDDTKQRGY